MANAEIFNLVARALGVSVMPLDLQILGAVERYFEAGEDFEYEFTDEAQQTGVDHISNAMIEVVRRFSQSDEVWDLIDNLAEKAVGELESSKLVKRVNKD